MILILSCILRIICTGLPAHFILLTHLHTKTHAVGFFRFRFSIRAKVLANAAGATPHLPLMSIV